MLSLRQQFKEAFKEMIAEIPKMVLRSAYGLSVEDEKRVDMIEKLCGIEKYKLVMWRSKQILRISWEDILYFAYRFEKLPTNDEIILIYQYGLSLYIRLKRLNKI